MKSKKSKKDVQPKTESLGDQIVAMQKSGTMPDLSNPKPLIDATTRESYRSHNAKMKRRFPA